MGPQLEYLETILTCKGNFYAPDFSSHLDDLKCRLQELVFPDDSKKLVVKKVEPWNSVRVTLKMPVDAAQKLKRLAEQRDRMLHEIGVLEVQIEGDRIISLAIEGSKPEGLEQSIESGKKSEIVIDVPPCRSGQCVPSKETLKPFANLPQSANLEWPLFTKILNSIDRSVMKVNMSNASSGIQVQVSCSKADQNSSGMNPKASPYQNSTNFPESCNITQNASSPFELTSQVNRTWIPGEEKSLNCQNIASSSPLLVNLLKSPGGRTQTNSSLPIRSQPSCELLSDLAQQAQKRRRSQTRKSKRLKEGIECANVSGHSSFQGIPTSHPTFQQELSRTSSLNVLGQTSISESRQIINPYTGDLEAIEEREEPSNSNSSVVVNNFSEPIPSDSSLAQDINKNQTKTSESTNDISEFGNHASSHSSVVSSCLLGGALRESPYSDASSDFSLRSNIETSTPATFNPSIPVFSVQSQWSVNMNLPHTFVSSIPSSLSENGLLLNHALSSCYVQNMLKALTSENAKFLASQSLVFPSVASQVQEESKSIIDANSLARIIVQSSLLPKSFDVGKSTCPLPMDSKSATHHPGYVPMNANGQLPKQMTCSSRSSTFLNNIVPLDSKIPPQNNVIVKEGVPQQINKKLANSQAHLKLNNVVTSTQASQLMKEMFPCLSLPVFSSASSFPVASAAYNGHVGSPHRDQVNSKTSPNEFLKTITSYQTDCRSINGYSSPLTQISAINDIHKPLTTSTISFPLSSSSNCSDGDGAPSSYVSTKSLSYRKPNKNIEDSLPTKSKANLTVAQLLEQVEIAKNHMTFSSSTTLKNNLSDSPLVYMSSNVGSTKQNNNKSDPRSEAISQIQKNIPSPHCNFGPSQKLLAYPNPMPFNVLDSIPMPITSPGYPHNLTESVQKAMQGVGFDNSPSTSPPPTRKLASLHHSIGGTKGFDENKSGPLISVDVDKEESVGLTDLEILGNQFELGQLEEALKSSLKSQEIGGSCVENQKHLIDLDSADLDFVFNTEDENQLESLIALKDYDDIEKLAETLASNIDGGDIDEEILISEKELETFDQNNIYKASKSNSSLPSKTPPNACTSLESDVVHKPSSLLDGSICMEDKTKVDLKNEDHNKVNLVDESVTKQTLTDSNVGQVCSNIPLERIKCKNSNSTKKLSGCTLKGLEFSDEIATQSASNRMATRSSNKQKCQNASSVISNLQNESKVEAVTPDSKDMQRNNPEATLQPLLRRSNRTIRKTELAVESLQTKSVERSKRSKDDSCDNKLNSLPSVRTEHGTRAFRQKSSVKRKHSSKTGSINENVQTTNNDVQRDQGSLKRIACNNTSTTSGPLELNVIETDFILCSKRPKTS